ncbi:DDE family endonuclease (macronuclear) [Tetrahymena thermophila SB210]|uniref:DDE family endonuclease n=1 Tax=Tetrahymena thermophila (strain SB210) TaxID=312017 RepID=W7XL74_TETTS|nr:DDE family endonuclease [Tetrahymena thermophila SB210]EWS75794.1 DDE family endonuclease [Tetrahymena thermophila SB210]|eukprot:XP_012651716.1 DDE family endonuclease [Tetrahymena thermophila SB210]
MARLHTSINQINDTNQNDRISIEMNLQQFNLIGLCFLMRVNQMKMDCKYGIQMNLNFSNKQKSFPIKIWKQRYGVQQSHNERENYIQNLNVDSFAYIQCLETSLLPFTQRTYGRKQWILFQDGAQSHTSKQTQQWLTANKIEILQNFAWSPDTNPIELVWMAMKKMFKKINYNQKIKNKDDLIAIINEIWNNLDQNIIINCINHVQSILLEQHGNYLH